MIIKSQSMTFSKMNLPNPFNKSKPYNKIIMTFQNKQIDLINWRKI